MAKKALGKGLDALISGDFEAEVLQESIRFLRPDDIIPNRYQPRKQFDRDKIEELAQSIRENGIIQPIVVRSEGDKYEIIVGERRLLAAKRAKLDEIPAIVKDYSEQKLLELTLIENLQREDLNPIEEALAFQTILEKEKITQEELSKRIGKSRSYIANMMRILDLPEEIRENVSRGTISVGQAKALLSVSDREEMEALAKRILSEKLTVRQLERIGKSKKRNVPRGTWKNPYIEEIEGKLRDKYGTKVSVDYRNGKGNIRIEFYSDEELERIIEEMV
jgi:ParB family chromosome partitioning protein